MFFRRARRADPRPAAWSELAARLELARLDDDAEEALRAELAVDTGTVAELHALRRDGLPELLVFEHVRPNPARRDAEERRARVLLRSEGEICPVSWRAFPRSHPLLASLQASRSGGELVSAGDARFDEAIGLVAREPEPARAVLTPPVREALLRLLADDGLPDATATCGGGHLAWRAHREMEPPFDVLDAVATRLFTLWAALRAGGHAG
jgi:hypothetical protein